MRKPTVLIIGASGTIGAAVARTLDQQGFQLGLHYCTNREIVEGIVASSENSKLHHSRSDMLDGLNAVDPLLDFFFEKLGTIDGLALCAGRVPWQTESELTEENWQRAFFELAVVPYHLALAFSCRCDAGAKIAALSSISAKYGGSSKTRHYGAAKSAFEATLIGLARQVADQQICVNIVRAGFVLSPQQTKGRSAVELGERAKKIPFGRAGQAEEIATMFSALLSPQATFTTGQKITVAGGD